ncbi:DUF5133 domain-containing protein [Streptomyces aureus]|uniref:DUF5133 domain-containing protein n=1 Tax=Streptomyces aureus TaxID=193461 RepID=UPI003691CB52
MLMPHPATLRALVRKYEDLLAEQGEPSGQRLSDLAYMGTREVTDALAAARAYLDSPSAATARISTAAKERGTVRPLAATRGLPRDPRGTHVPAEGSGTPA